MSEPSAYEQFALELINAQRLNPHGAADAYGASTATITAAQLQPLAFNLLLNDATEDHAAWLLQTNRFSHTGRGNSTTEERMEAAGYEFSGDYASEANIALYRVSGNVNPLSALETIREALFLNPTTRARMLDPQYREIGIGYELGRHTQYNAALLSENFAVSGDNKFITGVIYSDSDLNGQFSYNEGVGGATIRIQPQGGSQEEFNNYATGGYTASTTASGLIDVEFSLNGATVAVTVEMGVDNVKVDLRDTNFIASSASAFLGEGAVGLELLGINDTYAFGNDAENTIIGNAGDNRIAGGEASDVLTGNGGSDTFVFDNCHDGVDLVTDFVSGTDVIEIGRLGFAQNMQLGQLGVDSLVFGTTATQNQAQFLYDQSTGNLSIDMDGTGFGEALVFANLGAGTSLAASDIVITAGGRAHGIIDENLTVIENNGAYQLAVTGDGAYLISNGLGTSVTLKMNSWDVTTATFAGWSALQAEATATGFTALWQGPNGDYAIWQTDSDGNYLGSKAWPASLIKEIEPLFVADVDGDGNIGASKLIEDAGAYELSTNIVGAYQISDGSGTPVTLKLNSADVTVATFAGWSPLQAEATATGFKVLWQAPDGGYAIWQTDAAGNYLSSKNWPASLVKQIEPSFAADIDGDGQVGAYELIEDNGAYELSISSVGAYQVDNGAGSSVTLKMNSADVTPGTFPGWSALQVEATASGFTVLWQAPDGGYAIWQTDAAGNYLSSKSLPADSSLQIESLFAADLDGDGKVGVIEDNGAYQLSIGDTGAYQVGDGVGLPVTLKINSVDIKPASLADWNVLQAEATATGFTVLWQASDGSYAIWQTDAAGNYVSSKSLPEASAIEIEALFATDLDGDGKIGVIEDNGAYQLSIGESGALQVGDGVGAPVSLKINSVDIKPASFADWSALQAEANETGFTVLWQDPTGGYSVWQTDAAGNYLSSKSKSDAQVTELESLFSTDLNGDGGIGLVENNGTHQLFVNASGAYEINDGESAPVVVKLGTSGVGPTTFDGWSALQAEATATGFAVLWQDPNGGYTVWETDPAGNYLSSKSKSDVAVNQLESQFSADLNGDGGIGLIENNGAYELLVNAAGAYQFSNEIDAPIVLEMNSAGVGPTTFSGWSAIEVEANASGFAVLWQDPNGGFAVWQTDASGGYESSYALPAASLAGVESLFAADLNNDGEIGLV